MATGSSRREGRDGLDTLEDREPPSRSLEKVREILFGPRSREAEQRLTNFEDRLEGELASMRSRLESLERSIRELRSALDTTTTQTARLGDRLDATKPLLDRLGQAHDGLAAELRDVEQRFTNKAQNSDGRLKKAEESLEGLESTATEALSRTQRMEEASVQRQALARLLRDFAAQLADAEDPDGRP